MLNKAQSIWHSFRHILHRVGSWFHRNFKHVTGTVRYMADKIHGFNIGALSTTAGLVSKGTHIADQIYDYTHEIFGFTPPDTSQDLTWR